MKSQSVRRQTRFSGCFRFRSTRCNHLQKWKMLIFIVFRQIYMKNVFFLQQIDFVHRKWIFHTKNDTKHVISTCTSKIWKQFLKFFCLKTVDLKNSGVAEATDYEFSVRFANFKMADPIWRMKFLKKFQFFKKK